MIQNLKPYDTAKLVDPQTIEVDKKDADGNVVTNPDGTTVKEAQVVTDQVIAQGPLASQEFIKQWGTNGGGFFNANSAHPLENPTPFTNLIALFSIFAISAGLTYTLGRMTGSPKHGWAVWAAMAVLFLVGVTAAYWAEARGNPLLAGTDQTVSATQSGGNMEGKEVRFGIANSALFATVTTDASCGAVNSMHDSFTPLGGMVPLANIMLSEVIFGGVGAGMYGILIYIVLAVFIAGSDGRAHAGVSGQEDRILRREDGHAGGARLSADDSGLHGDLHGVANLRHIATEQCGAAWACRKFFTLLLPAPANNGSAFAGISANTLWYNSTIGMAMLVGRFFMIIPMLAIAGNLARKKTVPPVLGTFPVTTPLFTTLLVSVIVIVGALTFFPALEPGTDRRTFSDAGREDVLKDFGFGDL